MRRISRVASDEGSTLVITAVGMLAIVAFVGLSIDIGSLRFSRRHLQAAADAAALSAALQVPYCENSADCAVMQTSAQTAMTENGFVTNAVSTNCSGTTVSSSGLTLAVNNPPCYQGKGDPNAGKSNYVEVVASETQQTFLTGLLGFKSFPLSVRAEASKTPNPNCIYALDPTGGNAITVDILATVSSSCGVVDESRAWNALSCSLIASLSAPTVEVVGGAAGLLCLLPSTKPRFGIAVPNPVDPLSNLPRPAVPACGSTTAGTSQIHGSSSALVLALGNYTLYPDQAYCGGIVITGANVTFMPGTYVIKSNGLLGAQGGLVVGPLANVTGNGVTFYNYGPKGSITFLASTVNLGSVRLIAPTTGTYNCVLFFQDPQDIDMATIAVSSDWNVYLEGAYYFPNTNILYAASLPVKYNFLIAKDIEFLALTAGKTLKTSFNNDYSSLSSDCLAGGGSVLVQ